MKHSKGLLLLLALSASLSAHAAGEEYLLRRIFTEGETMKYKVSTVSDMTADMIGQQSQLQFQNGLMLAITVGKVNKETGTAEVSGKITEHFFKMEPDMSGGQMSVPKEFSFTGKLSNRYEPSDVKYEGLDAMAKAMAGSTINSVLESMVFPEGKIKVGDSWEQPKSRKADTTTTDQAVKATLVAIEKMGDRDAFKITLKGKVKSVTTPPAGGGGDNPMGNMKTTSETEVDSVIYIDKETGKMLKATANGPINITTELTDMGMTIPMKGTYTSTIEIAK